MLIRERSSWWTYQTVSGQVVSAKQSRKRVNQICTNLSKDKNCRYAERQLKAHGWMQGVWTRVHSSLHPFLKGTFYLLSFDCCLGKVLFSDCPWPPQGRASPYELLWQACEGRRHGNKVTYPPPPQPLPPDVTPVNVPHCLDLIYTPAHSVIKAPSCSIHTASLCLTSQGCRFRDTSLLDQG